MAKMRLNRDSIKSDFTPLDCVDENGNDLVYTVDVKSSKPFQSKASGSNNLKFDLVVSEGPEQKDGSSATGRHIFANVYAEDDGKAFMLDQAFDCFGVTPDADGEWDSNDFVGQSGQVTLKHEEYNGKTNERIKKFLS